MDKNDTSKALNKHNTSNALNIWGSYYVQKSWSGLKIITTPLGYLFTSFYRSLSSIRKYSGK